MINGYGVRLLPFSSMVILFFMLISCSAHAAQDEILLGTSTAISGPAKFLGKSMVRGINLYLQQVNDAGGINGKKFRLITLDDSYHPQSAKQNMLRLINEYQVLAVIGNVGTPTAKEAIPLANEHGVLLFGTFSGASILRKTPPDRYVINYRASYEEEMARIVKVILDDGITGDEIAFFTQKDAYGDAGHQAALKALKAEGYLHGDGLAHGRYTRNTLNVEQGLLTILNSPHPPRAIIMVGTYGPSAKFIRLARDVFPHTLFFNLSFIGAEAFAAELATQVITKHVDADNNKQTDNDTDLRIYVSQVVPPLECDRPGVKVFCEAMKRYAPDAALDSVALEGYWSARVLLEGIKRAGDDLNRESLIDALESIQGLDIGNGAPVSFSKDEHQASHQVWLTRFVDGRFVSVGADGL